MLAQLGDILFELLKEPIAWSGEKSWRYAEHPIIWGETKLQYTGHEPRAFDLSLRFHASFCDPEVELKRLEDQAWKRGADGFREPLTFILGTGEVLGRYVITKVGREYVRFFPSSPPTIARPVEWWLSPSEIVNSALTGWLRGLTPGLAFPQHGRILEVTCAVALREFA